MSQLGMNLPGSQRNRGASMNIYTGLLFLAVVCLGAATAMVWMAGMSLAPEEGPLGAFKVHDADSSSLQFPN